MQFDIVLVEHIPAITLVPAGQLTMQKVFHLASKNYGVPEPSIWIVVCTSVKLLLFAENITPLSKKLVSLPPK